MEYVYGVFLAVDSYEGEDVIMGLYQNYVDARERMLEYLKGSEDADFYVQKIKLGEKCDVHYQDLNGEYMG